MTITELETIAAEVVRSMLTSLDYDRDTLDMMKLCRELKKRMRDMSPEWTDDGNFVYGTLVVMFGDYGTSPRSGWFRSNRLKEAIIKEIERYEKELVEVMEECHAREKLNLPAQTTSASTHSSSTP